MEGCVCASAPRRLLPPGAPASSRSSPLRCWMRRQVWVEPERFPWDRPGSRHSHRGRRQHGVRRGFDSTPMGRKLRCHPPEGAIAASSTFPGSPELCARINTQRRPHHAHRHTQRRTHTSECFMLPPHPGLTSSPAQESPDSVSFFPLKSEPHKSRSQGP